MNRILPNSRISKFDRDDFVRNLLTVLHVDPELWLFLWPQQFEEPLPPVPLSPSAAGREAVLTLPEIKLHCHIEPAVTAEDSYLQQLEMAARLHTENALNRRGALGADAPENVKQAMLVLIAHWYRNRESVSEGEMSPVPMAYDSLLSTEKDYAGFC